MYLSDIASEAYYAHSPRRLPRTRDRDRNIDHSIDRDPDHDADHTLDDLDRALDATTILSRSQSGIGGPARRTSNLRRMRSSPSAAPTSIPLDDNFDAYTTEVPTEWHAGDHDHGRNHEQDGHPEYDESVSGYRNYVTEMERMLSGQMESAARAQERQYQHFQAQLLEQQKQQQQQQQLEQSQGQSELPARLGMRRSTTSGSISESPRGPSSRLGSGGGRRREREQLPAPVPPPENAREVSGKKGKIELVEQHVLEDSPVRTISLWRERVAASSAGGTSDGRAEDLRSDTGDSRAPTRLRAHRPLPPSSANSNSDATRLRRATSERPRYVASTEGSGTKSGSMRGAEGGKHTRALYERSEVRSS